MPVSAGQQRPGGTQASVWDAGAVHGSDGGGVPVSAGQQHPAGAQASAGHIGAVHGAAAGDLVGQRLWQATQELSMPGSSTGVPEECPGVPEE